MTLQTPPTFLIVGAARSGTSALASYIEQHPKVSFTRPKETHFFAFANQSLNFNGPGDEQLMNRVAVTDPHAFDKLMGELPKENQRGEGSVSSLYYARTAIENIRRYCPNVRLIAMLRDPVERAFSSYQYMRSKGLEPEPEFGAALDAEAQRIKDGWHHIWHYASMGRYHRSLSAFRQEFGAEQLKIVFYEDFEKDASAAVRDIWDFLGEGQAEQLDTRQRINKSGVARNRVIEAGVQMVINADPLRKLLKSAIPLSGREAIRNVLFRSTNISSEDRSRLATYFADENSRLRQELGRLPDSWVSGV